MGNRTRSWFLGKLWGVFVVLINVALISIAILRDIFDFKIPLEQLYSFLDENTWLYAVSLAIAIISWIVIIIFAYPKKVSIQQDKDFSEEETVLAIHRKVILDAQHALDEIKEMKEDGFVSESINSTLEKVNAFTNEKKLVLDNNVNQAIDDKFYYSALKSMLPGGSKKKHTQLAESRVKTVLDDEDFSKNTRQIIYDQFSEFTQNIRNRLRKVSQNRTDPNINKQFKIALNNIRKNKSKFKTKYKNDEVIKRIIEANEYSNTEEKTVMYSTAFPLIILPDSEVRTMASEIVVDILSSDMLSPIFNNFVVEYITDFIKDVFGEEVIAEVLGALGLAATGIGTVWLLFRAGRYGMIAKKLFYDKVPLQGLRKEVVRKVRENIQDFENDLKFNIANTYKDTIDDLHDNYLNIIEKSKSRISEIKSVI